MKFNTTILKVLLAFVVVIGALFWLTTMLRPQTYEGANLTFEVASGAVNVTNASTEPINVQLVSDNSTSFRVTSSVDGVTGSSVRQGTGSSSTQLYEFVLPVGESEFSVVRGKSVNFVANTATNLQASVQPVDANTVRNSIIFTLVIIVGALYYASFVTEHQWTNLLRGKAYANEVMPVPAVVDDGGQGQALRSYGDNRSEI